MIKLKDILKEGSCGYGVDGKVGKEPAGPHLIKKKKKKVDELVVPMSVSNPAAYKAMLDKQISKNVKVKTALGNKDHKDHKKAKSLLKRFMDRFRKKESVNEAIPKLPRINMGFGEAQDYSKMMIEKSEMVYKSTRAGNLGKAKKAVKDMEEIVVQIKRVLGI